MGTTIKRSVPLSIMITVIVSFNWQTPIIITNLVRNGRTGTTTFGTIDNLSMSYAGNQRLNAYDAGTNVTLSASYDGSTGREVLWDFFDKIAKLPVGNYKVVDGEIVPK
nr:hypothetical protein [uncultured Bacteroides sp.]